MKKIILALLLVSCTSQETETLHTCEVECINCEHVKLKCESDRNKDKTVVSG